MSILLSLGVIALLAAAPATTGLTLGPVVSVYDQQSIGYYGPGPGALFGPFGAGQFCGTVRQPIFTQVGGRRKVIGTRMVRRCFVSRFAYTSLTLTSAAM